MTAPWEIRETPDTITITLVKGDSAAELKRLRKIETAVKIITDLPLGQPWHVLASILREEQLRGWAEAIDAVASMLEAEQ